MKVKEESEKVGLKLNIQTTKIMTSDPITSWQINGETMKTVTEFTFLGSKITADGDCSHEIKRCFFLERKAMTNLDSILKSRDITLPTKVCLVKTMVFPVIMYGCENWTIKKVERWSIDAFELWRWRRFLRVPWTTWRSSQSSLKEISPGCSLEGRMLKLKLQYFGHLMRRTDSLEKTLMLEKIEGRGEENGTTEDEMVGWHQWLNGHEFWVNSVSWWWTGRLSVLQSMGLQRVRHNWAIELNCPYLGPFPVITDKAIYLKFRRILSKKITSQDEIPREAWPRVLLPLSIIFPTVYLLIELLWWKTECLLPWEGVRR